MTPDQNEVIAREVLTVQLAEQIEQIKKRVAEHFGHTLEELNGDSREEPLATDRQIAMVIARKVTGASFPVLARAFHRTSHETVRQAFLVLPSKVRGNTKKGKAYAKLLAECAPAQSVQ